jgi:hypothetical protein
MLSIEYPPHNELRTLPAVAFVNNPNLVILFICLGRLLTGNPKKELLLSAFPCRRFPGGMSLSFREVLIYSASQSTFGVFGKHPQGIL